VIGVYEPMILLADGAARETSRAAEPDAATRGDSYHGSCYAELVDADGADETFS
jgi:hypothetical protein